MTRFFRYIILFFGILTGLFVLFLLIITITDYSPAKRELLYDSIETQSFLPDSVLSIMIWNIGYGGLGEEMDFFYDGGKGVRPKKSTAKKYAEQVFDFVREQDSLDFIMLQEVDKRSKRSYRVNQVENFEKELGQFHSFFAQNYNVVWVPVPLRSPLGKVNSGLFSCSRAEPVSAARYSFPGNYTWPVSLFMLDRCFLVMRFNLPAGNEFVLVNTHNSAYDDGNLRDQQMEYFRSFLLAEKAKGNLVLVGGDWNQSPSGYLPAFEPFDRTNFKEIPSHFPEEGWKWAFDSDVPTNRRLGTSFMKGETPTTLIDFYLCSPGIMVHRVKTKNLDFEDSDHNPVFLTFSISEKQ